jgi:hypothetical protein
MKIAKGKLQNGKVKELQIESRIIPSVNPTSCHFAFFNLHSEFCIAPEVP